MDVLLEVQAAENKTFPSSFIQSFLNLILIVGLLGKIFFSYDYLQRRIQTASGGDTINYYYDPEVEFLELGHSVNGNRQWNLYGPDRSGIYGGAQGIGGLETCFDEHTKSSFGMVNNYFGDVVGLVSSGTFTPYQSAIGAYGAMPGSSVNQALQPQWRGHYLDATGFYYMGARYYNPQGGRFISPDPLGHSSSLGLYDYCGGDPVNGLDADGRCVEKTEAAAAYLGNKYVNYSMNEIARQWDESEAVSNNFSNGNYTLAAQQYLSHVGASLLTTIIPEGKPIGAALEGAYYLAQESAPVIGIGKSVSSAFPAGYQGGPGAMWSGENLQTTPLSIMETRLRRLGYDNENSNRILESIANGEQVVIVGENMKRVDAVSRMVDQAGGESITYSPRNFSGENRNSLEANRSWFRYWARNKNTTTLDIGPQNTLRKYGPSPFYQLENRSLNKWDIYTPFTY